MQLRPGIEVGGDQESEPASSGEGKATAAPSPDAWPADEMSRARLACDQSLATVAAVVVVVDPIKQGDCGTPAPVQLVSIGRNPEVKLSPPATMTCDMVAALAVWLEEDVQPLARKHLGAPVVRINTLSSYSCRNAYGRKRTRLSEHGRVNALDLGGFVTAAGMEVPLSPWWGMTARDVRALVAAEAAARKRAEEEQAKARQAAPSSRGEPSGQAARIPPASSSPPATPGGAPNAAEPTAVVSAFSKVQARAAGEAAHPAQLGGPKVAAPVVAVPPRLDDGRVQFLRAAHALACRRFGTVLGPEANEAHRDHLHLDMAVRTSGSFCE